MSAILSSMNKITLINVKQHLSVNEPLAYQDPFETHAITTVHYSRGTEAWRAQANHAIA